MALLTELAVNTQYACDAVAVSSGIWSVEQHQVTAMFRTLEREHKLDKLHVFPNVYATIWA